MPQKQLPIPTGSYAQSDPRASVRRVMNCYAENGSLTGPGFGSVPDSKQTTPPVVLRRAPGIKALASDGSANAVRGLWAMQGIEYAVIGSTLYTVTSAGILAKIGSGIVGAGFVRMCDNTQCLVILIPGTATAYTYDLGSSSLKQITAPGFTSYGAIDMAFIDSYIVFLALNGREFFNDDGQIVSGTGPITFTSGAVFPREYGTDNFIGMAIENRTICMFGERTSEFYIDAGTPGTTNSPFVNSPDGYLEIGMVPGAAYTAVKQDNSVFWLASDRTIRRLEGQTPVRVSNHGIEGILKNIDVTGCYAFAFSMGGHLFIAFTFPASDAQRTLVYDCTTGEWHERSSQTATQLIGYWRPLCCHNAFGKFIVGDSQAGQIGLLDSATRTEWGGVTSTYWIHQPVYSNNNRISHRRLELVLGGGFSPTIG